MIMELIILFKYMLLNSIKEDIPFNMSAQLLINGIL